MSRLQVLLFGFLINASVTYAAAVVPSAPKIAADGYLLIDYDSEAILVAHNVDAPLPPASLTKLMTAYILAEEVDAGRLSLDDTVQVTRNAWSQNPIFRGSSLMWIEPGLPVTVRELERGIVISSGNDATVAIAEHIAGSESAFAGMMNSYAELLGMENTHYVNSHGLPAEGHVTTARDLAKIAIATIRHHPERYKVYKEQSYTYNEITQYNRNHLLREDESVDGLKTGYTSEAGYGLVASAERDGMRLVSVVMGSASTRSRKAETRTLLNYGFRFFQTITPLLADTALAQGKVWKGTRAKLTAGVLDSVVLTVPRSRVSPEVDVTLYEPLVAPISRGDTVGTVLITIGDEEVGQYPLHALDDIPETGFLSRVWDGLLLWLNQLFV